ncbi:MAG: DNRLRE domain-containing protein [Planctomycetes bacterium]|nr:DNRLRE domain-containing protein [Planctomycetota bacterium]
MLVLRRAALALALASVSAPAQIQIVELEPTRDTTLYFDATGSLANGAGSGLFVGRTGQGRAVRALLFFDVAAAVPAGMVITRAELELQVSRTRSSGMVISVHRLNQSWGEGSSNAARGGGGGAPATTGDATWLHRFFPSQLWATPGGDFAVVATAMAAAGSFGPVIWPTSAALVADAQTMLDHPATNFGWLLRGDENTSALRLDSREASAALRPKLRLRYGPRAELASFGAGCSSSGSAPLVLSGLGLPRLGTSFQAQLQGAPNGAPSFLFYSVGLETTPISIGNGCSILLDLASSQFFAGIGLSPYGPAFVTGGVANHSVALPFHALLAGVRFEYQAFVLDPSPTTVRSSNVLRARLGL